jgi:hypothetical protein
MMVGEVAPTVAGLQNLLAHPIGLFPYGNIRALSGSSDSGSKTTGTAADDENAAFVCVFNEVIPPLLMHYSMGKNIFLPFLKK